MSFYVLAVLAPSGHKGEKWVRADGQTFLGRASAEARPAARSRGPSQEPKVLILSCFRVRLHHTTVHSLARLCSVDSANCLSRTSTQKRGAVHMIPSSSCCLLRKPFVPKAFGRSGERSSYLRSSFRRWAIFAALPLGHRRSSCTSMQQPEKRVPCTLGCCMCVFAKDVTGTAPVQVVNEARVSLLRPSVRGWFMIDVLRQVLRPLGTGAFHAAVEVHGRRPGPVCVASFSGTGRTGP